MHALQAIRCCPEIIKHDPYILEFLEWIRDNDHIKSVRDKATEALDALYPPDYPCAQHISGELNLKERIQCLKSIAAPFAHTALVKITTTDKEVYHKSTDEFPQAGCYWAIERPYSSQIPNLDAEDIEPK